MPFRPRLPVQAGDGAAGAVGDPEPFERVLAAPHPIPHRDTPPGDLEALGAELAGVIAELLAGPVEPVNVLTAVGQDHHVLPGLLGLLTKAHHDPAEEHPMNRPGFS